MAKRSPAPSRAPAKPPHAKTANPRVQAQTRKVMRTHYAAKYRVR